MNDEKKKYYEKTVELLLSVFKELRNDSSYAKNCELSDRKFKILVKEYGSAFSRENVLFSDKFLIFAPSFVATYNSLRSACFEKSVAPNKILDFKRIKEIRYNLMPCETSIHITTTAGATMELYDGVPKGESYEAVKSYVNSVRSGSYKTYAICLLSCIYALTAMHRCKPTEYSTTYETIEKNIKQLVAYCRDTEDVEKKYGKFFSFDFVTCDYNPETVEKALDKVECVMEEFETIHEEEIAELKESFVNALDRKMEETRQQYENRSNK